MKISFNSPQTDLTLMVLDDDATVKDALMYHGIPEEKATVYVNKSPADPGTPLNQGDQVEVSWKKITGFMA